MAYINMANPCKSYKKSSLKTYRSFRVRILGVLNVSTTKIKSKQLSCTLLAPITQEASRFSKR